MTLPSKKHASKADNGQRKGLARRTPLVSRSILERRTPLVARVRLENRSELKRSSPLRAKPPAKDAPPKPKPKRPAKLSHIPKRSGAPKEGNPIRDPGFLAFIRTFPCEFCGTTQGVQAHHFGAHGMATKASDHEAIPLCYLHHVEGWHRHGTLPGRTHDEWIALWEVRASALLALYEAQGGRRSFVVTPAAALNWRERFLETFGGAEPGENGPVDPALACAARAWLLRHVWPCIPDGDEWEPFLCWHHGELLVLAENYARREVLDLDTLMRNR